MADLNGRPAIAQMSASRPKDCWLEPNVRLGASARRLFFLMPMSIFSPFKAIAACVFGLAALGAIAPAAAQEANTSWRLRLLDLQQQPKTEATLQFTDEPVRSCMRGKWKRLVATASEGSEPAFFPLHESLAYKVEHGVLTMGRSDACRRFPLLSAISSERGIHGTYRVVSVGRSKKQGLFTLDPT